jgi:hypothetical protein
MRQVHWVSKSSDKKIGKIVASYSPLSSCPDSCAFKDGGCYAWGLFYLRILGKKIENGKLAKTLADALKKKDKTARVVRHRVAGDIVGDVPDTIDECKTVEAAGLTNLGYTHAWKESFAAPLKKWFRASCNTLEELDEALANGWSTTLAVSGNNIPKSLSLANKRAVVCPARNGVKGKKDITCNTCALCAVNDKTKDVIVLFEVHGNGKTMQDAMEKSVDITSII